ncbi:hypothetical protein BDZ97DRAFT_429554 [Flammula alnicola]|nr:hypothetical protein BDZ97DRAFT_429554 [Flammula alnicola]
MQDLMRSSFLFLILPSCPLLPLFKHTLASVTQTVEVKDVQTDTIHPFDSSRLTTEHGVQISDTDNWGLKAINGIHVEPSLLEDQTPREKSHCFDHERILERIVYSHGAGAYAYFRVFGGHATKWTSAPTIEFWDKFCPIVDDDPVEALTPFAMFEVS